MFESNREELRKNVEKHCSSRSCATHAVWLCIRISMLINLQNTWLLVEMQIMLKHEILSTLQVPFSLFVIGEWKC